MQILKKNKKMVIGITIAVVLAVVISTISSYVLAETIINSKDVYYKDNSGLLADNVQDAIDGTCIKFEEKVDNFLDKIYPVGSIYITTTLSTVAQVKEALGGEWETYGNDRVLRGTTSKAEVTGGSDTVTLEVDNLPSHSHNINHTHTTAKKDTTEMSLVAQAAGKHTPQFRTGGEPILFNSTFDAWTPHFGFSISDAGGSWIENTKSMDKLAEVPNHTHSVTGSVSIPSLSTNSISDAESGLTGGNKSFSVQNSYITVYMYKRTK